MSPLHRSLKFSTWPADNNIFGSTCTLHPTVLEGVRDVFKLVWGKERARKIRFEADVENIITRINE